MALLVKEVEKIEKLHNRKLNQLKTTKIVVVALAVSLRSKRLHQRGTGTNTCVKLRFPKEIGVLRQGVKRSDSPETNLKETANSIAIKQSRSLQARVNTTVLFLLYPQPSLLPT